MKKVYIFGVGKGKKIVNDCINANEVQILGYIDNAAEKYLNNIDGLPVNYLEDANEAYDYIIVSVMKYVDIEKQLCSHGVPRSKIICFFDIEDAQKEEYWCILDKYKWKTEVLMHTYMHTLHCYQWNAKYEIADEIRKEKIKFPHILSSDEAIEKICKEGKSLVRFGDGEFASIMMRKNAKFQTPSIELSRRLREVLDSNNQQLLIAIADNYGSLEKYTEDAACDIRGYMTPDVRAEHMDLLDMDRVYYDAYFSRPYMLYKDKGNAALKFANLKKIWEKRDVVLIEGEKTRIGVQNDLLDNANSVKRIIAPAENAFAKYKEILVEAKKVERGSLILISLGAAAKILTYDLFNAGYQVVDIGHIDLEYEWFLRGVEERIDIPYKYVNEVRGGEETTDDGISKQEMNKYLNQIICKIL